MNKRGVLLVFLFSIILSIILSSALISAQEVLGSDNASASLSLDKSYSCLEQQVSGKCSALPPDQIALSILAVPSDSIINECKNSLLGKECVPAGNCNIKSTALAILALNSLGENADLMKSWLLQHTQAPKELSWFIQIDADQETTCKIEYSDKSYDITIAENKVIDKPAGDCLKLGNSDLWLQVLPSCNNIDFTVSCNKDFRAGLVYQQTSSQIFSPLNTDSSPALGSIKLNVNSDCIATDTCNYEDNLWATLALFKLKYPVNEFIPYLNSLSDSNPGLLPDAFLYMISGDSNYANSLLEKQDINNYWQVSSDKIYDTAIALLALKSSSSDKVDQAKGQMLFSRQLDGCWNSLSNTALMLWALTDKNPPQSKSSLDCESSNFVCVPQSDCNLKQQLSSYTCAALSDVCCSNKSALKTCDQYKGAVCSSTQTCSGDVRLSSDGEDCCTGTCQDQATVCEQQGYICRSSCVSGEQVTRDYECKSGSGKVCCLTAQPVSYTWLIWLLVILILAVLIWIGYVKRSLVLPKIHEYYTKLKLMLPKKQPIPVQAMRARPGFPPIRRQMPLRRPFPQSAVRPITKGTDKVMDDVFKKLKDMTK